MFEQNNSSLYPAVFGDHLGLGFWWSETSSPAAVVEAEIKLICAGISLSPRISASMDSDARIGGSMSVDPRITATVTTENC